MVFVNYPDGIILYGSGFSPTFDTDSDPQTLVAPPQIHAHWLKVGSESKQARILHTDKTGRFLLKII